ncbi:FtsX-like permease family protein, partial [Nonomuraea sp. NPDC004297]
GPDVVALAPDPGPAADRTLTALTRAPGVVAHHGPYQIVYTALTARGFTSQVVVHGAAETPGSVDRPLVTSGRWVRPGGAVLERGFATALGVGVGDRVTIAGRSYPVEGIAVTAATSIYPWAAQIGPGGGPSDWTGLAWLTPPEARALAASGDLPVTTALDIRLRDPDAAEAFVDARSGPAVRVTFHTWQFKARQDAVILNSAQPILVVGGWLLSFLAVAGVATLAAGRTAAQTYRAGLLKAVGATPGLIAAVLLTEYLALALVADVLGLVVAQLAGPAIASPTASRIGGVAGPAGGTVLATTVLAVGVAALSALPATVRALRTATVTALAGPVQRPRHRPGLVALSALLPTPLLLGLRLMARRPGRAVLHACSTAATLITVTVLLFHLAQPSRHYGVGAASLPHLRDVHDRRLLLAVTVLLVALAVVNTVALTWTTAMETRANMAVARTLGATPWQVSAGLSAAQVLPAVLGALAGLPLGIGLYRLIGMGKMVMPPWTWLLAATLAILAATAVCAALPARLAA